MKKNNAKINWLITIGITLALLIIDQCSKSWALNHLSDKTIELSPFLNFILVWNAGIAFGLFANLPYSNILFIMLSSIIVGIIIYIQIKDGKNRNIYALIIAGAIGNIFDRMYYGAVLDFIDFHISKYHWPAFNIADSLICIGAVFLLLDLTLKQEK